MEKITKTYIFNGIEFNRFDKLSIKFIIKSTYIERFLQPLEGWNLKTIKSIDPAKYDKKYKVIVFTGYAETLQRIADKLNYGSANFINFTQDIGHQPYKLDNARIKEYTALRFTKEKGYKVIGWRKDSKDNVLTKKEHICKIK